MESSGRAVFKTVPGFAFRATFEVDIEGFTPVKVMEATTVLFGRKSEVSFVCLHMPSFHHSAMLVTVSF